MNIEKIEKAIAARADTQTQTRIKNFCNALENACDSLSRYMMQEQRKAVFDAYMNRGDQNNRWPKFLWENERDRVREELFATFDIVQRAFVDAENHTEGEFVPVEPENPLGRKDAK